MPQWISEELRQIDPLTAEIASCGLQRRRAPLKAKLGLRLSDGLALVDGLAGSTRALLVRQLLRAIGFDELRHLRWRVEHKLIQALVLRSWLPELIPVTCGLYSLARCHGAQALRPLLAEIFPGGYVLKSALGDSSGESSGGNPADAVLSSPEFITAPPTSCVLDEKYIVQERIAIATEYRVHSLEEDVIDDLTFRRYDGGSIPTERDAPNAFVRSVLGRLPDGLVGGSLLAWDIALQPSGEFAIIEVNFSGFHPEFKRGFHCSGYFHDYNWGACDTARLLNHVARTGGAEATPEPDVPGCPIENRFYSETANWQLRHRGLLAESIAPWGDTRTEDEIAEPLIREIDAFAGPRRRAPFEGDLELRLSDAIPLLPELAATTRQLMTRQVLLALGFDERRLPAWRLEHKLVQALVLRHYCAETIPLTCGLDRLAQGVRLRDLRTRLRAAFPCGFVIKTALGDSSGSEIDGRTESTLAWIESDSRTMPGAGTLTDEEFIVQERKNIRREYRVHTIEDRVIEDLTIRRHIGSVGPGERENPNRYVRGILDAMPAGITAGANLAWDVALLDDGSFAVIEVNIGGIHTVYNPGFHASGFFHHRQYGVVYTARLLLFLERTYGCRIAVVADAPGFPEENYFYTEVADWKTRF
jgi:hypothetical protein